MNVIIVKGEWKGAASRSAHQQGTEVFLAERTDMLLGTELVRGVMGSNGRYMVTQEIISKKPPDQLLPWSLR